MDKKQVAGLIVRFLVLIAAGILLVAAIILKDHVRIITASAVILLLLWNIKNAWSRRNK